jgi:hypothetical protein
MREHEPVPLDAMVLLFAIVGLVVAVIYSIDWSGVI